MSNLKQIIIDLANEAEGVEVESNDQETIIKLSGDWRNNKPVKAPPKG